MNLVRLIGLVASVALVGACTGATGGTTAATITLLRQAGGEVLGAAFVIDLPDLGGRRQIEEMGVEVRTLCEFEGE